MNVSASKLPQNCWIFEKGQYLLKREKVLLDLPCISSKLEYENILKANGIPYRKVPKKYFF